MNVSRVNRPYKDPVDIAGKHCWVDIRSDLFSFLKTELEVAALFLMLCFELAMLCWLQLLCFVSLC